MELLDVVDENDCPIGVKSKGEIHRDGDLHRASQMWIYNDRGEILFQLRSHTKDIFPGMWDVTGGHVQSGESYLEAAVRELDEELGVLISPNDLESLFKQRDHFGGNEFQMIYLLRWNSRIKRIQAEEVQEVRFWNSAILKKLLLETSGIFCPMTEYYMSIITIIEEHLTKKEKK